MKTSRTLRVLSLLLVIVMLAASFAACKDDGKDPVPGTTAASTENPYSQFFDAPEIKIDPNASVYNGTPDTSWYNASAKEFTLTSAAQLVGFATLITKDCSFEGVTIKLGCDMIINQGSSASIKANAATAHKWPVPAADAVFKGTFNGQDHVVSGVCLQATDSYSSMFGAAAGTVSFKKLSVINSYFAAPAAEGKEGMAVLVSRLVGDDTSAIFNDINLYFEMEESGKSFSKAAGCLAVIGDSSTVSFNNITTVGNIVISGTHAGSLMAHVNNTRATVKLGTCTNFANITAQRYCGGMVGQSKSQDQKALDCVNRGTLTAEAHKGVIFGEKIFLNDPNEGARPVAPAGHTTVRVMSFNVQVSLPKTGGVLTQAAKNRIEAVKQEILINNPDFLGLQEDSATWHENIGLTDYNIIHFRQGLSTSAESCAIYYKKGIPLLESGTAWLTSSGKGSGCALTMADLTTQGSRYYMTPEELAIIDVTPSEGDKSIYEKKYTYTDKKTGELKPYSSGYSMTSTRKMVWGVFDVNGQTVIYINTHLNHRSQNAEYSNATYLKLRSFERVKEFSYMQEQLAELLKKYPNSPVFMTGDWNDNWPSEICTVITEEAGFKSAHVSAPKEEVYGTEGSWNNAFNVDVQGDCYPDKDEGTKASYLDYCFVSSNVEVLRFIHGEGKAKIILKDGSEKYIYTSDHRPIITDISFKTPKSGDFIGGNNAPA